MRIGILGTAHAADYASAISSLADCELAGLFCPDTKHGTALARALRARFFKSADKLLEAADCVVLSVREKRLKIVERAASAGVHILCEVPFAPDMDSAKRIVDTCQNYNVRLMPALPLRFSTVLSKAKDAICAGEVDDVVSVVSKCRVLQMEKPSSGVIFQEGAHVFDLLRWMLRSEFTEIYAQTPSSNNEAFAVVSFVMQSGVIASVDLCRFSPDVHLLSDRCLWMKFVGTGGVIEVNAFGQSATVCGKESARRIEWGDNTHRRMIESFSQCIERGVGFEVSADDGLAATEIAITASRAACEGVPVAVS